jgi:hypothetical protein
MKRCDARFPGKFCRAVCGGPSCSIFFCLLILSLSGFAPGQTTRPAASTLNLESIPLADALQNIHDRTGLNLSIDWNAIQLLGIDKTTPVSLDMHGLSVGKALELILDSAAPNHQLTYYVKGSLVRITTQTVADTDMITRVYPIDDLLIQHENFQNVPFINIANVQAATPGGGNQQSSLQSSGQPNPQETEAQRQKTIDSITAAITSSIRPEIWKQNGGTASIFYFNGNLIVTAPRSVQSDIASPHN